MAASTASGARGPPRASLPSAQIAEGLAYLHESGVVHRDLSASNIFLLLEPSGAVTAKIGDFGLSRRTAEQTSMTALIGTIQYMAPEMLTSGVGGGRVEYSAAVDVFSYGIVLWQLLTCSQPYAATLATHNRFQLLQRIARDGLRPEIPLYVHEPLRRLMAECWAEAEVARPASGELVRRLRTLYRHEFGTEWRLPLEAHGEASLAELPAVVPAPAASEAAASQATGAAGA